MNRTRISRLLSLTALAVIGVLFSSSVIWAQTAPPADTLKVNYFSNANLGYPSATCMCPTLERMLQPTSAP